MNSVTVICRIKLEAEDLDALDFAAARQLQSRDDYVAGIVRRAIIKSVMTAPDPQPVPSDAPGAA